MHITLRRILSLGTLVLAACHVGDDGPLSPGLTRDLVAARARWNARAPSHYRYESTIACFCPREYSMPIVAEVRNGVVVDARYPDGTVYPYPYPPRQPIDSLFVQMLRTDEWVDRVEATFDAQYGYPRTFSIVPKLTIADGGFGMTITRFEALP